MCGSFVEYDDIRRFKQEPCNGQALPFPSREAITPRAHKRVQAFRQRFDERQHLCGTQCVDNLGFSGIRLGVHEVGSNGVMEQMGVLRDNTDALMKRTQLRVTNIDVVYLDRSTLNV